MPLYIENKKVDQLPDNFNNLFQKFSQLKEATQHFACQPIEKLDSNNNLNVMQREYAVVVGGNEVQTKGHSNQLKTVGSDDATTCCVIILRHPESGHVSVTHYDGNIDPQEALLIIDDLVNLVQTKKVRSQERSQVRLQCTLLGCYNDENKHSDTVVNEILRLFRDHQAHIQLEVACIGDLNTEPRLCSSNDSNNNNNNTDDDKDENLVWINFPRFYGSAVELATGRVFPATFVSKEPANLLRYSRLYSKPRNGLNSLWDNRLKSVVIHPFSYEPTKTMLIISKADDNFILKYLSTSPLVEPQHFADHVRDTFEFILRYPRPLEQLFPENKSLVYSLDGQGCWQLESS